MKTKIKCTIKFLLGLGFLVFICWLAYWLLVKYRVKSELGQTAIVLFLVLPTFFAATKLPKELRALIMIWRSDDPEAIEKILGDLRERNLL